MQKNKKEKKNVRLKIYISTYPKTTLSAPFSVIWYPVDRKRCKIMAGSNQKAQITLAWWLANCHVETLSYKRDGTADVVENSSNINICKI